MERLRTIFFLLMCAALAACGTGGTTGNNGGNPPPASAIKFVQGAGAGLGDAYEPCMCRSTALFTGSVTNGDFIVVAFGWDYPPQASIVSVTDSGGNSYKQALAISPDSSHGVYIYYATNVTGGANFSVTVETNQPIAAVNGVNANSMTAIEYSGISALDVTSTNSGSQASDNTPISSGDALTHEANELVVGVSYIAPGATTMAGSGFTIRPGGSGTPFSFAPEDKTVSSAGTYDAEFFVPTGCQSCIWLAGMATFH